MASQPGSVLFCCTENSIRSPMAEGLMKYLHGRRIFVDSVGVRAKEIDGFVIAVMDEIGIDMAKHRSKTFEDLEDTSFDLIISLSPEAQHSAVEMTRTMACDVEYWPTMDPSLIEGSREERLDAYRDVRDTLMARIQERFPLTGAPQI
jgi:protein-tyrosine-phosphatase